MMATKQNKWLVTFSVGPDDLGTWDSFEGGEIEGESEQYHAGGMAAPTSDVSAPEVSDITISRGWDPARDAPKEKWLAQRIGFDCVVGKQALNSSRQPITGALTTYTGRITRVSTPDHDSMGRDFSRFAVTIVVEGLPT